MKLIKMFASIFLQAGKYSNGSHCLLCPLGYYCESAFTGPQPCPDGLYADEEGLALCKACPLGQSCTNKTTAPIDCEAGYYSLAGDILCNVCCFDVYKYIVFVTYIEFLCAKNYSKQYCCDILFYCATRHPIMEG